MWQNSLQNVIFTPLPTYLMNPKANKTSTYAIIGFAALIAIGSGAFYLRKPSPPSKESYTLLSHNVADIQTNPIEYTSVLQELSNPTTIKDKALRSAAKQLLTIDTDKTSYTCLHHVPNLEKTLCQALEAYYQQTESHTPSTQDIRTQAENFLFQNLKKPPSNYALTLNQHKFSGFDKATRQLGITRFSPIFYDKKLIAWLQQNPTKWNPEDFTQQWIRSIKPHIKALFQQAQKEGQDLKTFRKNYLFTFLFDLHSTQRLFQHNGVQAWVTLAQKLQKSALGNTQQRNQRLLALYKTTQPDIICLQESDASLIQALIQQGYHTPLKTTSTAEQGSVILYKKSRFQNAHITSLHLHQKDIDTYQDPHIKPRSLKKLTSHEVAIHQVQHKGMVWLLASFHASSSGDNTLTFLHALFALQKRIEAKEGKKVLLLLGIDANTSDQPALLKANLKKDLQTVDQLLAQYKGSYQRILHQGQDTGTVRKERSTFQTQLLKKHLLTSGISDFILVSQHVSTQSKNQKLYLLPTSTYLSPYGPNPTLNPSDHRALALTFTLEKVPHKKTS